MAAFKTDGDFTTASATGGKRWFAQFDDGVFNGFDQDYVQATANWTPLALNTAHSALSDYKLVAESQLSDLGGGISRWTRTYMRKPDTRHDYLTTNYNFIGYAIGLEPFDNGGGIFTNGRDPFTDTVPAKAEHVYYFVGTNADVATVEDIPTLSGQEYLLIVAGGTNVTSILCDSPPFTAATTPSKAEYQGWVEADTWITAEDSELRRVRGSLWERITLYVKAK